MLRDPIETTLWLRKRAVDEVKRDLARQLATAAEASGALGEAERALEDETRRVSDGDGDDSLVEAFAAWLPGARRRVSQARSAAEWNEAEVARTRAELAACRAGLEAIETLIGRRQQVELKRQDRQMQFALDEMASRSAVF